MNDHSLLPRSVERSTADLRLSSLQRRIALSPSLAIAISDMAFGMRTRDHAEALHHTTTARVASYMEARP